MPDNGPFSTRPDAETASEETLLLNRLDAVESNPHGYYVVQVHLSQLRSDNRKPHFIRIAARAFESLTESHDATLFQLSNGDLALLCLDVSVDDVDSYIYKTRALFSEDPLTFGEDGSLEDRFTTWYDLSRPEDFSAFSGHVNELVVEFQRTQQRIARAMVAGGASAVLGRPLEPRNLSAIGQKLQGVRIADLIRSQSAVEVRASARGQVLFDEHYISMSDLRKRIAPEINLFGSTWLFQYLTEILDRRLLAVMGRRDIGGMPAAISLNLNISTVLSREFQDFHRRVSGHAGRIVIEVQLINVFADMGAFVYARDMLRERGYRVLIDGLSPLSLQFFDPGLLGADFVKIGWNRQFLAAEPDARMMEIGDMVESTGHDRVILSRVDSEDAVKWGLNIGVNRFQGYFIDKVVDAMYAKGII